MAFLYITSRMSRQLASSFGNNIDCLLTPKLSKTTSNSTTKYIMFLTIFPIIVTRGPVSFIHWSSSSLCVKQGNKFVISYYVHGCDDRVQWAWGSLSQQIWYVPKYLLTPNIFNMRKYQYMLSTQYITRPTSIYAGWKRNDKPIRKNIIATASQGFHMFHAHTWNFCLENETIEDEHRYLIDLYISFSIIFDALATRVADCAIKRLSLVYLFF